MSKIKERLKELIESLDEQSIKEVLDILSENKEDNLKKASDFMFELCNGMSLKMTRDKEITYYNSKNEWILQQNYKNNELFYNYYRVYLFLKPLFNDDTHKINKFIGGWVETNLNWKGLTPRRGFEYIR